MFHYAYTIVLSNGDKNMTFCGMRMYEDDVEISEMEVNSGKLGVCKNCLKTLKAKDIVIEKFSLGDISL
jgi:hypothetical protein